MRSTVLLLVLHKIHLILCVVSMEVQRSLRFVVSILRLNFALLQFYWSQMLRYLNHKVRKFTSM